MFGCKASMQPCIFIIKYTLENESSYDIFKNSPNFEIQFRFSILKAIRYFDVNLVCTKENLYKNYVNDQFLKDFHPYYSKYITKGYEHLYHKNHLKEIKMIEDMPYIIKNTALSVAYSKRNFEIIKLLESNKNIDKSKSKSKRMFLFE